MCKQLSRDASYSNCLEYYPPPDKSITIRAILLAAFSNGISIIKNYLKCEDSQAALSCIKALGASVSETEGCLEITGGKLRNPAVPLDCGSSGTVARLLCGLLAGSGMEAVVCGSGQLSKRPMRRITEPLRLMGAKIDGDSLPLRIYPAKLHGMEYYMPVASAQVKTALLFAGLNADGKTTVREPAISRNHGENILEMFGAELRRGNLFAEISRSRLKPCMVDVPGDFSSAAFFIAGAYMLRRPILVRGTGLNPGRLGMADVLKRSGAMFEFQFHCRGKEPYGDICFFSSELNPLAIYRNEVPSLIDEMPVLSVMAASIPGESVFYGIDELKYKESDRIQAIISLLKAIGAECHYTENDKDNGTVLRIIGRFTYNGSGSCGIFNAGDDHRMAMAAAIARLRYDKLCLLGSECVGKSYPGFFEDYNKIFCKL